VLIIDLVIVALTLGLAAWGFSRGLTVGAVALLGFGIGAVLGSRLTPLVLEGGLHSTFAPVVALPGALLFGGLLAAGVERVLLRSRVRFDRLGRANAVGGALVCACLGLLATSLIGSLAAQVDALRKPVQHSAIFERLNAALPPPGPVLMAQRAKLASFPTFEGPAPQIPRPDPGVVRQPSIKLATRSVAKVEVEGCGGASSGSGWFGTPRLVVTNAHVVAGVDTISVQVHGQRSMHGASAVWYDAKHDVALLRVTGLSGIKPLRIARTPKFATSGAMLGYPAGFWDVRAARLGETGPLSTIRRVDRPRDRVISKRPVTTFAGKGQPGDSGGPIVDTSGSVLTTISSGFQVDQAGFGVPNQFVRTALARAGPPVRHGPCERAG
jgi:S1-C subfamily serine protease